MVVSMSVKRRFGQEPCSRGSSSLRTATAPPGRGRAGALARCGTLGLKLGADEHGLDIGPHGVAQTVVERLHVLDET